MLVCPVALFSFIFKPNNFTFLRWPFSLDFSRGLALLWLALQYIHDNAIHCTAVIQELHFTASFVGERNQTVNEIWSVRLYCTTLLHCPSLYYTILSYTTLYYTILDFTKLYYTIIDQNSLLCTALHFIALQGPALNWTVLYCTEQHWNAMHFVSLLQVACKGLLYKGR